MPFSENEYHTPVIGSRAGEPLILFPKDIVKHTNKVIEFIDKLKNLYGEQLIIYSEAIFRTRKYIGSQQISEMGYTIGLKRKENVGEEILKRALITVANNSFGLECRVWSQYKNLDDYYKSLLEGLRLVEK